MSFAEETETVKRTIQSRVIWFVLVTTSSLLLAGWLYQVYQRPYTSIGVCILVVALLWYTASDDAASGTTGSVVHRKGEFEVVFWVVFALFSGVVFLMFPDSPILALIHHFKTTVLSWTQDAVNAVDLDKRALPVPASLFLVAVITLYTLHFARLRQRQDLVDKPDVFTRKLSANLLATSSQERVTSVKEAVRAVDECLRELDHDFLPSYVSRFIRHSKDLLNEAKIIRIFREAGGSIDSTENSDNEDEYGNMSLGGRRGSSGGLLYRRSPRPPRTTGYTREEYSYLVMKCDLALLMYKIKDHSVAAHRRQFIRVLCHERLSLLTTPAKAMVLSGLQKIKLSSDRPTMERAVFDILTSCRGHDLTELKAIMDSKGNYHSLHKLVFHDIKTPSTRKLISDHILQEAKKIREDDEQHHVMMDSSSDDVSNEVASEFAIARSKSLPLNGIIPTSSTPPISGQNPYIFNDPTVIGSSSRLLIQAKTKIISDVDDTLESSGGMYPAGVDKRYERHTPYPGVGIFYRELDLCGSGDVVSALPARGWPANDNTNSGAAMYIPNLVFLSARPHVYKDLSELRSYAKFANLIKKGILHGTPCLLPGSLITGREFILRDRLEPLADNKFHNFKEYATLYPEYEYIFVGDNGQADVRTVSRILDELPFVRMRAVFIHVVQPLSETYGLPSSKNNLTKFVFYTNYVQAGLAAYGRKLISAASLARITINAVEQFENIKNINRTESSGSPGDKSPGGGTETSAVSVDGSGVSRTDKEKTEQMRREINRDIETVIDILQTDLSNAASSSWSLEMETIVRELMFQIRPIDAPRYLSQGARVVTKYGTGEVEGFSSDKGFYSIRMMPSSYKQSKSVGGSSIQRGLLNGSNARIFSYYMNVKEDEQNANRWRLGSFGIFSRRGSQSDLTATSDRGSPSARGSPRATTISQD